MAATGDERMARRVSRNADSLDPADFWPDRDTRVTEPPASREPRGGVIELGEVDVSDEVSDDGDEEFDASDGENHPPLEPAHGELPATPPGAMTGAASIESPTERRVEPEAPSRTPLAARRCVSESAVQPRVHASSARPKKVVEAALADIIDKAGAQTLTSLFVKAGLVTVRDVEGLTAAELRFELERKTRGAVVKLVDAKRLVAAVKTCGGKAKAVDRAHKPSGAVASLIEAVTGGAEDDGGVPPPPVHSFADGLALVGGLTRGYEGGLQDHLSLYRQLLQQLGEEAMADPDPEEEVSLMAEQLERALARRGITTGDIGGARAAGEPTKRYVRLLLARLVEDQDAHDSSTHARQAREESEKSSGHGRGLEALVDRLEAHRLPAATTGKAGLEEAAAAKRLAAVLRRPADRETLVRLEGLAMGGDDMAIAEAVSSAQVNSPDIAYLLHSSGVKIPEGVSEYNDSTSSLCMLSLSEVRKAAQQVLRIRSVAAAATARAVVAPLEMPNVLDTKGLEQLANSIWDGELPLVTSTKKVSLDSFLEESSLPTVCASNESAKDWLLCKWPVVAALVQRLMPCDVGVAATLQIVTSKVRDDGTLAAAQLGCQKVVVPFLLQLNENWAAFQ